MWSQWVMMPLYNGGSFNDSWQPWCAPNFSQSFGNLQQCQKPNGLEQTYICFKLWYVSSIFQIFIVIVWDGSFCRTFSRCVQIPTATSRLNEDDPLGGRGCYFRLLYSRGTSRNCWKSSQGKFSRWFMLVHPIPQSIFSLLLNLLLRTLPGIRREFLSPGPGYPTSFLL